MKKTLINSVAALAILWAQQAPAVVDVTLQQWGTLASAATFFSGFDFDAQGGTTELLSSAQVSPPDEGSADSSVELQGGLEIPSLGGNASAIIGGLGVFVGIGSQIWQYNGQGETVDFNATLTGTITKPSASPETGLTTGIYVFKTAEADFSFPETPTNATGMLDLMLGFAGLQADDDVLSIHDEVLSADPRVVDDGTGTDTGAVAIEYDPLSLDLQNGDFVSLVAFLGGFAGEFDLLGGAGGAGDAVTAGNTLSFEIVDAGGTPVNNLLPAHLVPLPPAVWLFGSTVLLLAGLRRLGPRGRASLKPLPHPSPEADLPWPRCRCDSRKGPFMTPSFSERNCRKVPSGVSSGYCLP